MSDYMVNPTGIDVGKIAPDFTSIDITTNSQFKLSDAVKNTNGVVLNFYRGSF